MFDDDKELEHRHLLKLINIFPWDMEQKGGFICFHSRMVITINKDKLDARVGELAAKGSGPDKSLGRGKFLQLFQRRREENVELDNTHIPVSE